MDKSLWLIYLVGVFIAGGWYFKVLLFSSQKRTLTLSMIWTCILLTLAGWGTIIILIFDLIGSYYEKINRKN